MGKKELFWLSHSKVQSFFRCRKQYAFQYVWREEQPEDPVTAAGVVGTGVHRALNELTRSGSAAVGRNELEYYLRMTEPDHRSVAGPGTDAFEVAHRLYEEGCMVHDSIVSLEQHSEVSVDVPYAARGIQLQARIDRVDRLGPREWQLIDWKTGRQDRDEEADGQLDLGHVGLRYRFRLPKDALVTAISWSLRTRRRRVRHLDRAAAAATMERYAALAERMQAQRDFEAMPGPHCTLCPWQPRCPEGSEDADPEWAGAAEPEADGALEDE